MAIGNKLLKASIMHARKTVKENQFVYKTPYILIDESNLPKSNFIFGINRFSLTTLSFKQFGNRSAESPFIWVRNILSKHKIKADKIQLITQPKQYGYVFNPVSFYFCYTNNKLTAVLAEVNNTFKETHTYLIHDKSGTINKDKWYQSQKVFHVSPFFEVKGDYKFRFNDQPDKIGIWINYYTNNKPALLTSITGSLLPLTTWQVFKNYTMNPLYAFKVIFLIHWQAFILWKKGVGWFTKPTPPSHTVTEAHDE